MRSTGCTSDASGDQVCDQIDDVYDFVRYAANCSNVAEASEDLHEIACNQHESPCTSLDVTTVTDKLGPGRFLTELNDLVVHGIGPELLGIHDVEAGGGKAQDRAAARLDAHAGDVSLGTFFWKKCAPTTEQRI